VSRWLYKIYAYGNSIAECVNKRRKKRSSCRIIEPVYTQLKWRLSTERGDKKGSRQKNMFVFFLTLSAKQLDCT